MDRTRWDAVSVLLDEALDLAPAERGRWMQALASRDPDLAATVARLLGHAAPGWTAGPPTAFESHLKEALRDDEPLAGRRFGAWLLERKIGEGGMGQVWLAHRADGLYTARAAIKLLRSDLQRPAHSARFDRERAALARLNDPGIARLLDAGVADGLTYLVLEYVEGDSLLDHVRSACPTVASRVRLLIRIAQAVEHAHALLIVHRDLKPTNVMVTADGVPKLLDFGIAALLDDETEPIGALTRQAGRGLTLGYAAPEQITGAASGVAADVFSLGVVLYELLAGTLPFAADGASRTAIEHAVLHAEPRRLGALPAAAGGPIDAARARGDLEAIIAKALRKDPSARYRGVAALIADLRAWLDFRPVSARQEDWRHRSRLWLHRNALSAALGAGVVVVLVGGLIATTWQWRRAERAAHESDAVTTYLSTTLASANPDTHAGAWPTALQLLDRSRVALTDQFRDDPDVELRLLGTMATTYIALNRYDLAIPLAGKWVALSAERHGEDDVRTIDGRLAIAKIFNPIGPWERVIEQLEPERERVARLFGRDSERMLDVLHGLLIGYTHQGDFELAEQALDEAGAITDRLFPPGDFERVFHHNYEALLFSAEGRLQDALAALRLTEPSLRDPPPQVLRFVLVIRRSVLDLQIRLAEYDRIEERMDRIRQDADRLLGDGNALSANLPPYLARYHGDRGDYDKALVEREKALATSRVGLPAAMQTAAAAQLVLARALAHAASPGALLAEARATARRIDDDREGLGSLSGEAWLAVARTGLLLDDTALATLAIERLRSTPSLARDVWFASRVDQVDGELARARGDLARSRDLLRRRIAQLARGKDRSVPTTWMAHLDFAYTLALLHDPAAPDALARARRERPAQMPADTPMDRVDRYVETVTARPAEAVAARADVDRALGRSTSSFPLGGLF